MMFSIYTWYVVAFYVNIFKINIFFKRGKIKINQYFDYSVLEKNVPIKKSKTIES